MDLSNMSVAELRTLQDQVQQVIKVREKEEQAAARQKILEIAQGAGISLEELMSSTPNVKSGVARAKVAVQYRHPNDTSLEWTGRGRQPKWVQEWVSAGKSMDELRV
ncbi:H-NS histone family protein [Collimonas arenae]|uniref:H-NS histone family protein n=1 Tax=Collimonas arenae TaxID=279058 RepID=UPI000570D29A|nr:H-NS histone family protein [Collimonas arenae]